MKTLMIFMLLTVVSYGQEYKTLKTEDAVLIEYKLEEYHDNVNDQHIEYVVYKFTNLTNEAIEIQLEYSFTENGREVTSDKDGTAKVSISANGSVEGDFKDNKQLTMFNQFLVGNSGKKASETICTNHSVKIISKK